MRSGVWTGVSCPPRMGCTVDARRLFTANGGDTHGPSCALCACPRLRMAHVPRSVSVLKSTLGACYREVDAEWDAPFPRSAAEASAYARAGLRRGRSGGSPCVAKPGARRGRDPRQRCHGTLIATSSRGVRRGWPSSAGRNLGLRHPRRRCLETIAKPLTLAVSMKLSTPPRTRGGLDKRKSARLFRQARAAEFAKPPIGGFSW
jgi:hypothetical protein